MTVVSHRRLVGLARRAQLWLCDVGEAATALTARQRAQLELGIDLAEVMLTPRVLARAGCKGGPGRLAQEPAEFAWPLLRLLKATGPSVRVTCEAILDRTPQAPDAIRQAMPVWAVDHLRRYDLQMGTLILRAIGHIQPHADEYADGLLFIENQQQSDGRFGFFGPEVARFHVAEVKIDPSLDLYLPVTVSCLMLFAHHAAHFRNESQPKSPTTKTSSKAT